MYRSEVVPRPANEGTIQTVCALVTALRRPRHRTGYKRTCDRTRAATAREMQSRYLLGDGAGMTSEGVHHVSQTKDVYRRRAVYAAASAALAAAVVGVSFAFGEFPEWYRVVGFTLAAGMLGTRTIKLSSTLGTVSVGFMFVFAALIELGPPAGLVAATASAFGGTMLCPLVCQRKRRPPALVVVAAVGNVVVAAGAAGWAYLTLDAICTDMGLSMGIVPAFIAIGVYYVVNSIGVALMVSADGKRSLLDVWASNLSWTDVVFRSASPALTSSVNGEDLPPNLHDTYSTYLSMSQKWLKLPARTNT